MPKFDGTGPNGTGPGTGRRMGTCDSKLSLHEEEKVLLKRLEEIRQIKESDK